MENIFMWAALGIGGLGLLVGIIALAQVRGSKRQAARCAALMAGLESRFKSQEASYARFQETNRAVVNDTILATVKDGLTPLDSKIRQMSEEIREFSGQLGSIVSQIPRNVLPMEIFDSRLAGAENVLNTRIITFSDAVKSSLAAMEKRIQALEGDLANDGEDISTAVSQFIRPAIDSLEELSRQVATISGEIETVGSNQQEFFQDLNAFRTQIEERVTKLEGASDQFLRIASALVNKLSGGEEEKKD
jgi:chromosome segregation ATPase